MQFGLRYCNTGRFVEPKQAVALLQAAEEAGFDSAWTVEHIVVPGGYQSAYPYSPTGKMPLDERRFALPDPLIWMTYVAAATSRIKLATGVIILPEHNPGAVRQASGDAGPHVGWSGDPWRGCRLAQGGV